VKLPRWRSELTHTRGAAYGRRIPWTVSSIGTCSGPFSTTSLSLTWSFGSLWNHSFAVNLKRLSFVPTVNISRSRPLREI
jgi:hypothetical protein